MRKLHSHSSGFSFSRSERAQADRRVPCEGQNGRWLKGALIALVVALGLGSSGVRGLSAQINLNRIDTAVASAVERAMNGNQTEKEVEWRYTSQGWLPLHEFTESKPAPMEWALGAIHPVIWSIMLVLASIFVLQLFPQNTNVSRKADAP